MATRNWTELELEPNAQKPCPNPERSGSLRFLITPRNGGSGKRYPIPNLNLNLIRNGNGNGNGVGLSRFAFGKEVGEILPTLNANNNFRGLYVWWIFNKCEKRVEKDRPILLFKMNIWTTWEVLLKPIFPRK